MAAKRTWRGALTLAGFPIHVEAYARRKSTRYPSFKTLAPTGEPIKQVYLNGKGKQVSRDVCKKGVEVPGGWKAISDEAAEAISERNVTTTLEPERFCPVDSIPMHLSMGCYQLVPDPKVPGSENPVSVVWNGLRDGNLAYVTEWTPGAASSEAILVITAGENGLRANTLPYVTELNAVPEFVPAVDKKAANTFAKFVEQTGLVQGDFDHAAFTSSYAEKRDKLIAKALKGQKITAPKPAKDPEAAPDLMQALEASLAAGSKKRPSRRKPAGRKKVAA